MRLWRWAEVGAWAFGILCLGAWGTLRIEGAAGARRALASFEAPEAAGLPDTASPLAVLRIPKTHLEVAVLRGTDDATLNRGVGHIDGTALPGEHGNAGIAGHRDGFFRSLKDLGPADIIEIESPQGKETYRVERIWVVDPDEVSVLDPTPTRSLTLVTCYPFYFVGPAPQRYIVRAVHADEWAPALHSETR
jgi:sortase A